VAWSKKRNALGINLASCRLHRIKNLHQSNNNLLFTGRELDLGGTVYYFRGRYYNAGFQRFLSEDPIGFAGGDTNLYRYGGNNPLVGNDPTGLQKTLDASLNQTSGSNTYFEQGIYDFFSFIDSFFNSINFPSNLAPNYQRNMQPVQKMPGDTGVKNYGYGAGFCGQAGRVYCSETGNGESKQVQEIDPATVRFSQDSISPNFKNGGSINSVIEELKAGKLKPSDFPPIRLVEKDGNLFTLDNRRLEVFRRAKININYRMATPEEVAKESFKFTTKNNGVSIQIRGQK
jgi:RHS repeat-associated protein